MQQDTLPEELVQDISDEDLLARYQNHRSQQDFEELVRRCHGFCYRVAISICRSPALAEEAVQETYLYLAHGKLTYEARGAGSCRRWLMGIVLNKAKKSRRGERRIRVREASPRTKDEAAQSAESRKLTSVQEHAWRDEAVEALRSMLHTLDERARLFVVLHFVEGISQHDIGRLTGTSQAQVSRSLSAALEHLRKRLSAIGIVAPLALLPDLFQRNPDFKVPDGIARVLNELIKRPKPEWAESKAKFNHMVRWFAVGMLVTSLAGICMWGLAGKASTSGSRASAVQVDTINPGALPLTWDFSQRTTEDVPLDCVVGTWAWQEGPGGVGRMSGTANQPLLVMPRIDLPHRPLLFRARVSIKPQMKQLGIGVSTKDPGLGVSIKQFGFGVSWIEKNLKYPSHRYFLSVPKLDYKEEFDIETYLFDRWVITVIDHRVSTVREFEKEYPADRIAIKLVNTDACRIEIKDLDTREIPEQLRDPLLLIKDMSLCPADDLRHLLNPG